jgi:glycosyltransferase involved in cell wall biosynthesis
MKVLHLLAGNIFGGIETGVLALVRQQLPGLEHEVALFFDNGRLGEELLSSGIVVHFLGPARLRYPWTVLRARRNLRGVFATSQMDAVIAHSPWSHVIAAPTVRERGKTLAHYAHGFLDPSQFLDRWASRTPPDLLIANSHGTEDAARALFPQVRSTVIYEPVAGPASTPRPRAEVRAALGTPQAAIVVIMASRLEPWKGHELLLASMERLDQRFVAWIAGGPQRSTEYAYLDVLRARAPKSVTFLGQRRDVYDLMSASDIHCQPNVSPEPFGIAFVEALHAQLPVVTTRMGGALEIVDERCGVLVPPAPESVAAALDRLGRDPNERRRLGTSGPARARALCDPRQQAQALLASLRSAGIAP